jgi:hypothetical protein
VALQDVGGALGTTGRNLHVHFQLQVALGGAERRADRRRAKGEWRRAK